MPASKEGKFPGRETLMNRLCLRAAGALVRARGATLVVLLLLAACGDSTGPDAGGGATLSGTVRAAGSSAPLADAKIQLGTLVAISDGNGRFELADVPVGAAVVRAERPGYTPADAAITITAGANSHDFTLAVKETYAFLTNAVYVPAGVGPLRGAMILLGGPVTTGFVTGERITPLDEPAELEQSLQALGASLRALAASSRVALLGSKTTGMENSAANDAALFAALSTAAEQSGHPELVDAPVLMIAISGGSREAAGLVSRHPERAIGLLARVPAALTPLTQRAMLAVPTFVMQAEEDGQVNNFEVRATFSENRSRGGLWALAVEPDIVHAEPTARGNSVMMGWLSNVLAVRLPAAAGAPLIALEETSGWLGNQTTLDVAPWASYLDDPDAASWLLSELAAGAWRTLGGVLPPGGG